MANRHQLLNKIIIISLLSALCCSATFIQIRMPSGDMVHLGNFVMIISALLLGGISGGLVGSLGMGLYDLIFYTQRPSTILRTFILKFIVGFVVGYVFRLILKKKIRTDILLMISILVFMILFGLSLGFFIVGDKADLSFKNGLNSVVNNFLGTGKNVKISLYIPIFSAIFFIGMVIVLIFQKKLSKRNKAALFSITIAVLINIIGEFLLRWILEGLLVNGFNISLITATSKIPGSLITGFVSTFLAILIYEPIYRAVKNVPIFKDDTIDLSSDEEVIDNDEIQTDL